MLPSSPLPGPDDAGRASAQAEIDAALATFGTWTNLHADRFLRELDQARSDDRPPIDL